MAGARWAEGCLCYYYGVWLRMAYGKQTGSSVGNLWSSCDSVKLDGLAMLLWLVEQVLWFVLRR